MTSLFLDETQAALNALTDGKAGGRYALKRKKTALLVSGVSAKGVNERVATACERIIDGLKVDVLAVENDVLAVVGVEISEQVKITKETKKRAYLSVKGITEEENGYASKR